ncbi:SRPBCC family protein [Modestobacter sp. VKM Ac-2985]|uniref:SRPBCC family protein n=1 Tax=Modestobacter sp. VKM Ac-2985 TaxID=3004139 RepID=UPI0022ABA7E5|nr:SRPBCC family protein [Modestobacter sp. VKM Ac-2985]MCZ2837324.1 SRPBCC family protein [Modestobacter sp. VKM Ac-2985]
MKLENRAVVQADADVVFGMLNDPEAIVGCVPGGALTGRDGDAWAGGVTVKVGPITAAYAGTVRFVDVDEAGRSLRLVARGADTRGSGDAEAEVVVRVQPVDGGSELLIDTDLLIRGKIAQFGKGAIAAVSTRILQQFAAELGRLAAQDGSPATAPAPTPAGSRSPTPVGTTVAPDLAPARPAASELNAFSLVIGPVLKEYGRPVALVAFGLLQGWVLGRAVTIERFYRSTRR